LDLTAIALDQLPSNTVWINGSNLILAPGLVDLYSYSGEPGLEDRETLVSLMSAAWAGGFTQIGILPQSPVAPEGLTVHELVAQGRYPHQGWLQQWSAEDERIVRDALAITNMADFADRPLDTLSGGQRQRAWIAMSLAQQTEILLLDEPTTFLDLAYQLEVLDQTWTRWVGADTSGESLLDALADCFQRLTQRAQLSLNMRYAGEASREQIAESLEISSHGVKNLQQRAKAQLRECLEEKLKRQ
jgi:hypothetical protein